MIKSVQPLTVSLWNYVKILYINWNIPRFIATFHLANVKAFWLDTRRFPTSTNEDIETRNHYFANNGESISLTEHAPNFLL